ncbi:MAG: nitroreductase family protein [Deltaproteobacteria bacterium]|nr:nitroreductase family protein [Deltaproteobacteria bacterium]
MTTSKPAGVTRRRALQSVALSALWLEAAARFSFAAEPATSLPTSFADVVKRRAMIRSYKSDPVPEDKLQRLLEYATRAPSGGNLQPWEFIVVKSPEGRAKLAEATGKQTSVVTAPVVIVACANIQRAGKSGGRGSFFSLVDTAFASLLILLGAVEQGLGACFVGSYDPEAVAKQLGLPDYVRPVGMITLGFPAERPQKPKTPKLPLTKVVHQEKW